MKRQTGKWSKSELQWLGRYAALGLTSKVAAEKLRRPHAATRQQAMVYGIKFYSYGTKA